MNLVKIEVHVDPTNPKEVEALNVFLSSIGSDGAPVEKPKKPTRQPAKKVEDVEVKDAEVVNEETPATQCAEDEAPKEEPTKEVSIKIEDVRALLSKKVANNRETIKAKLTELEANNVTSLDKSHYASFVEFLNSLS